jgi:outer membrane lipoprotein-sorting protein
MVPICSHLGIIEALKRDALKRRFRSAATRRCFQSTNMAVQPKRCNASTLQRFTVFSLWLLLLWSAVVCRAQNTEAQFNRWFEVQTNIQSWTADFIQTRTLTVLNQPLVSTGKVWVTTGEFRWELGQPAQTIVLRQPDQLLIVYPRLKRVEKYPLNGVPSGPMKDALTLLDATLPRDRATMEKSFRLLSAAETNSILQMTLQPRSESARQFISEIVIGFHTNNFTIAATEMKFADGSSLRNDFTNVIVNQPIDSKMFEANLPSDYTVVEPLKQ